MTFLMKAETQVANNKINDGEAGRDPLVEQMDKDTLRIEAIGADLIARLAESGIDVTGVEGSSIYDDPKLGQPADEFAHQLTVKELVRTASQSIDMAREVRERRKPHHLTFKAQEEIFEIYAYPYLLIGASDNLSREQKNVFRDIVRDEIGATTPLPAVTAEIISNVRQEIVDMYAEEHHKRVISVLRDLKLVLDFELGQSEPADLPTELEN